MLHIYQLFLYDPKGSGKTLYVHALANELEKLKEEYNNLQKILQVSKEEKSKLTVKSNIIFEENKNLDNQYYLSLKKLEIIVKKLIIHMLKIYLVDIQIHLRLIIMKHLI